MARVMRGFAVLAGLAAVYDLVCYIGTWVDGGTKLWWGRNAFGQLASRG
jgi:hypothetical protein